jgi:PAS domain S-box-containing protein
VEAGSIRILLVEDNPGDARLIEESLRLGWEHPYVLETAEVCAAAESRCRASAPDVVLLDPGLPDSGGLATVERIIAVAPGAAVVVLTGAEDDSEGEAAIAAGAQDFLHKGEVHPRLLARSIRYALARRAVAERDRQILEERAARLETERHARDLEDLVGEISQQRALLDAVVEHMPAGLAISESPSGRWLFLNPEAIRLLGPPVERGGIDPSPRAYAVGPDGAPLAAEAYPHLLALREGKVIRGLEMHFRSGSRDRLLSVNAAPVLDGEGRRVASVSTYTDVTRARRVEERERTFARLLEGSRGEIYMFDAETLRFEFVNRGARENLGLSLRKLRRMTPLDLKPSISPEVYYEILRSLREGERGVQHFETEHRRADGSLYPVDVHLQLSTLGKRQLFVALILDLTERKRAESQHRALLREQEARRAAEQAERHEKLLAEAGRIFAANLEEHPMLAGVADLLVPALADACVVEIAATEDRPTRVVAASGGTAEAPILEALSGEMPDLREPGHPANSVLASGRPLLRESIDVAEESRAHPDCAYRAAWRDARVRSLVAAALPVQGRVLGTITLLSSDPGRAFTRRDAELLDALGRNVGMALEGARLFRAAREARRRTEKLQEVTAAFSGALTVEEVGRVVSGLMAESLGAAGGWLAAVSAWWTKPATVSETGWPDGLERAWERFSVDARVPAAEAVRTGRMVIAAGGEFDERFEDLPPAVNAAYGTVVAAPLLVHGRAIGAIAISYRERIGWSRTRQSFLETVANLCAQALDRAQRYESERRAVEERDTMLGVVAHDLRSPLAGVKLYAHLLEPFIHPGERPRQHLHAIGRLIDRMDRLIQDLLDVSRIEAGVFRVESRSVPVASVIDGAVEVVREAAAQRSVTLEVARAPAIGPVRGDADRLVQALVNLLSNAIEHSPPGASVTLHAAGVEQGVRFGVIDRGPGIRDDHLPRLFDRFWQAEGATRSGAGLGLPIVKAIVDGHGGTVEVETEVGRGSTFSIVIPEAAPDEEREDDGSASKPARPAPPRTLRLVVVDDHAAIRRGVAELLSRAEFVEIVGEASSGEAAVDLVREARPDVVVMDLVMPGTGGIEATRRIIELGLGTRVIALTADPQEESLLPVMEAGATGFVLKKEAHHELLPALRAVASGEVALPRGGLSLLAERYREAAGDGMVDAALRDLSEQDRSILRMSAEGYTSREIGKALFLSPHTVASYRSELMKRLGLSHRTELVRLAVRSGLLAADAPPEVVDGPSEHRSTS